MSLLTLFVNTVLLGECLYVENSHVEILTQEGDGISRWSIQEVLKSRGWNSYE